ncbi:uncharacterized protein LOC134264802 [Saccostrea cucullata]|uniref:uncharacterized protein LOC134264802 n=1 Tax=Saccostrea cuccullata TaxID=36930 RepID=UPI002ED0B5E8
MATGNLTFFSTNRTLSFFPAASNHSKYTEDTENGQLTEGSIVGITVTVIGVVFAIFTILFLYLCFKKKKNNENGVNIDDEETSFISPECDFELNGKDRSSEDEETMIMSPECNIDLNGEGGNTEVFIDE